MSSDSRLAVSQRLPNGRVPHLGGTERLADDLYLIAHSDVNGRPCLQPRALGLGLAGGLLAELMLAGRINARRDEVVVADGAPPAGDELARHVLGLMLSEHERLAVQLWLLFLARAAAGDVARRLARSGYLTRAGGRRRWGGERWVPVDADSAFAPFSVGKDRCKSGVLTGRAGSGVAIHPPSPREVVVHVAGPRWPGF